VAPGIYHESIVIDKPLSLIGESKENTIIIGPGSGDVIYISSDKVTVNGFTVENSGSGEDDAGIELNGVIDCYISNCIATNNRYGIYLNSSDNNRIENNTCHSNWKGARREDESQAHGIFLVSSSNNTIKNNKCKSNGCGSGIYIECFSNYNIIENNTCTKNLDHGIKLVLYCNNNIVKNNTCLYNENAGIFLATSNNNILASNTCNHNKNNPGIILKYFCNNNTIVNNVCNLNDEGIALQHSCNYNMLINNTCKGSRSRGIFLWSSNNNTIIGNTLSLNGGPGIRLDNSSYNEVYYNNILRNWRGITIMDENSTRNKIHQNNIARNVEWGLLNEAFMEVNATLNWWGSPYGPEVCQFVEEIDPEDPEEIWGNILYEPWLAEPYGDTMFDHLEIVCPGDGVFVSGIITISATVEDPSGVDKVEFYIDDLLVFTDTEAPYEYEWNTTAYADGTHMVKVRAYDTLNNMADKSISVIADNTSPNLRITNLSGRSTIWENNITVTWNIDDAFSGIAKTELSFDRKTWIDVTRKTAYIFTGIAEGSHIVSIRAFDKVKNMAEIFVEFTYKFTLTDLSISPMVVTSGEIVSISVRINNRGNITGTFTVPLWVNGSLEATKDITLAGGETKTVVFEVIKKEVGTFDVEVAGLKGSFIVKEAPPPLEFYVAIVSVVLVAIGTATIIYIRKRVGKR